MAMMMRALIACFFGFTASASPTGSPTSSPTSSPTAAPAPSPPSCFPGEVAVDSVALAEYDSALGFLHALPGQASFVTIEHESGELRASGNHLVFNGAGQAKAAEQFLPGDDLLLSNGLRTRVLNLRKDTTQYGMYAPLTASGTVSVEGVKASNYATVGKLNIPHSAMHASFVISRMFSPLQVERTTGAESVNPLAHVFHNVLKLDKLL